MPYSELYNKFKRVEKVLEYMPEEQKNTSKKINPKIGKTIAMLRKSKKLSLKEMTGNYFSESQLARFEKGETDITISKFLELLKNSNIYLDEFQNIYNEYAANEEIVFQQKLTIAYSKRDINTIKDILEFWNERVKANPEHKFYKINQTVVKVILSMAQKSKIFEEDIDVLMDYLDSVSDWGRYEIWIFGNCLRFFDDNALKSYGLFILGKTNFYNSSHLNQQMVLRTFLNMIDFFLRRGNLIYARKYINHLESMNIKIDFFYEKIILKYHEAHYHVLQNQKEAIKEMRKCAEMLEVCGYQVEAKVLFDEIENL